MAALISSESGATRGGLVRHTLVYGLAQVLRYVVSFGMTRFYTAYLIAALYGVKEVIDLWMILLQQVLGQNLLAGMMRQYYEGRDERERASVVTSTTLLLAACAWGVCVPLFFLSDGLAPILIGRPTAEVSALEIADAVRLLLLLVPFQLTTLSGFYYLQTIRRSGLYTAIQTAKLLLEVALHVVFMGILGWGLSGFLLGLVLGEALTTLGLTGWVLASLRPRFDWRALRPVLVYAAPLIPVGVFQLGLHQLNRRLIEVSFSGEAGLALAGIYGLGYKIGQLVNSVLSWPFLQIWQPTIFALPGSEERARLVARVTTWMVVAISACSLLLILGGRQAVDLLAGSEDYLAARSVVPWVAAAYVFWGLYLAAQTPLLLARRTVPLFWINLLALAFTCAANLVLIPRLEIVGAALAALFTFALLAVLVMLAARRVEPVPFEVRRIAASLAVVLTACGLAAWIDAGDPYASPAALALHLCVKSAAALALGACLWRGVLRADERARLLQALRSRLARRR